MTEFEIMQQVQVAASRADYHIRLFRNNVGQGWQGKQTSISAQRCVIAYPRPLKAGLCVGSSDLIGWRSIKITPDMVGQTVAIFSAVEVKTPQGKPTEEQVDFLAAVNAAGGIGIIATSSDDVSRIRFPL